MSKDSGSLCRLLALMLKSGNIASAEQKHKQAYEIG